MIRGVTFHRGLSCSSLFVTPLWRALGPELNPRVKATVTLLGAGTVGAYIVFKIVSKLLTAKNPASDPKQDASISALEDQLLTVPGLQNTGNSCFLNVILQALASSEALLSFMDACASMTTETDSRSQGEGSSEKVAMPLAVEVSSLIKGNMSGILASWFCPV
ncbi:hypothetical protein R1flu_018394 [Riccia fluitans]|uniref:Peptidase C19 ubiquitin carboxyl-terminal hydrolase domain-containing protein n=1 Tax=Riccia fluitans TaxID=41844 RepID=A0ABD1ZFQ1_9MARC